MHHLTALFFSPLVPMSTALWPVPQLIAPPPPEHLEQSLTTNQNFLPPPAPAKIHAAQPRPPPPAQTLLQPLLVNNHFPHMTTFILCSGITCFPSDCYNLHESFAT